MDLAMVVPAFISGFLRFLNFTSNHLTSNAVNVEIESSMGTASSRDRNCRLPKKPRLEAVPALESKSLDPAQYIQIAQKKDGNCLLDV